MRQNCDAVFVGGGVKGIGFVGAIAALEKAGYQFHNVVGTSAGAIAAALVAVGYTGAEIETILKQTDYTLFREKSRLHVLGPVGSMIGCWRKYGIYKSNRFFIWLDTLLKRKGKSCFGDIKTGSKKEQYMYRFQALASDITDKKMLVLPNDLKQFGIDPDTFSIARAVQMSMSIPFFFRPVQLTDAKGKTHLIVDGGLLSNYPVWVLDDGTADPPWPTFGFKFLQSENKRRGDDPNARGFRGFCKDVLSTLLETPDNCHVSWSRGDYQRSIFISTEVEVGGEKRGIKTTDFSLTRNESQQLFRNGFDAATDFLRSWDFAAWKHVYRAGEPKP